MPINRRQFIKRSAGAVSVGLVMPTVLLTDAKGQGPVANPNRKIFVVIQQAGGNDGLNTVIPYTNSRYQSLRPTLAFKDAELKDAAGRSTILGGEPFAFHPALAEVKELYDAGRVAPVLGVGYPAPNLSHFLSQDIYHTANTAGGAGNGWLGKYADQKLLGQSSLSAVSVGNSLPKSLAADKVVVPSISNFANYTYQTDERNRGDRNNQVNTFHSTNRRDFPPDSFIRAIADTGVDAADGAAQLQAAVGTYSSPVTYPAGNPLASGLKMVAQIVTTIPEANLLYVTVGGWDHHSQEIGNAQSPTDKSVGQHATLLGQVSQGIKAFYDDMLAHGLADNVVIMTWTEFGRRPNENASHGTDHGTANVMFVVGNPVRGGKIYGEQPSLDVTALDSAGNMRFTLDFRAVYATILDKWLGADSRSILGGSYENVGFLG
ncbi:MAG: DUF1501 domain-containing protein [Blastocatellia bacterium]